MNVKRKSASEILHLRCDLLALLACYALLSCLLTLPNATKAQVGQEERGLGVKLKESAQKVALVIGNADYDTSIGKLKNPINDATDIAAALTRLGFKLVGGKPQLNLNKRQMLELIREFGNQIGKGGVGVFYFAGHGVQIDKRNYLIPITNSLQYQEEAEFEAVDVDQILRQMEYAGNALNIMILDACRNNDLPKKTRNAGNGLGEPQSKPSGVFIAFAARDGQVASENSNGRNGLYTQELLRYLETPNLRLEDIFINTRREVKRISNRMQEPIEYGSLDDVFYFKANENTAIVSNLNPSSASKQSPTRPALNIEEKVSPEKLRQAKAFFNKAQKNDTPPERRVDLFTKAIELNPNYAEAYLDRGVYITLVRTIEKTEALNRALKDISRAIEINPQYGDAYFWRGNIYLQMDEPDNAIIDYNKTFELTPKRSEQALIYAHRGEAYREKGDHQQAITDYTKGIELDSKCIRCYDWRAKAYEEIGRKDLAEADRNKWRSLVLR